jgi:BlaI family penicillinase repressor
LNQTCHKTIEEQEMTRKSQASLSRRERQMMDIIYQRGSATAAEILNALPDPPSYSAVRAKLRVLEEKGHIRHKQDGPRYVFLPTVNRDKAKKWAVNHLLQTFFDGSTANAVSTLLDVSKSDLSKEDLEQLTQIINKAKKEGK